MDYPEEYNPTSQNEAYAQGFTSGQAYWRQRRQRSRSARAFRNALLDAIGSGRRILAAGQLTNGAAWFTGRYQAAVDALYSLDQELTEAQTEQ